ncbi:MAG: hypothetical protein U0V70_07840 [Terriglobia bacterium]
MNRKGGVGVIAVLLTILGMSYLPRQGSESKPDSETKTHPGKFTSSHGNKKAEASKSPSLKLIPPCQQIKKQLRRFFEKEVPYPDFCLEDEDTGPNNIAKTEAANLQFLITLVANPVQTHLPLFFDRSIEAIQQALQDENYAYDGSWFPWSQTEKGYELLSDEREAKRLETEEQNQPGIMIFRRGTQWNPLKKENIIGPYAEGLVVFVVAEQPTGGLNDLQFEHALQWMQVLKPSHNREPLRILGPTFSGSLPSLARELALGTLEPRDSKNPNHISQQNRKNPTIAESPINVFKQYENGGIKIFSGSASSETNVGWFKSFLAKQKASLPKTEESGTPKVEFRTYYESDSLITDRFLCYLQHQGYSLDKVAILSEDETAFGKEQLENTKAPSVKSNEPTNNTDGPPRCCGQQGDNQWPIYLYYPRDIATLRSAYEKQSIFSSGKQQGNVPSSMLRADLSESATAEHDTVRTYGGDLTPLAQETALFGIANILDQKHIEFVILRSSNSLDQLFLSEFLRRSYPAGRVVIDGADLLFRRGMQGASLRGVMLLSPYPLLSWTQKDNSYRVFPQDYAEGIYIAARKLIHSDGKSGPVPIIDYTPPRWAMNLTAPLDDNKLCQPWNYKDNQRPATWILVVGHRQFWPVAVVNSITQRDGPTQLPNSDADRSLLEADETSFSSVISKPPRAGWFELPGEMGGLLVICMMLSTWHFYCCWKGSVIGSPRARAHFAPIPRIQHCLLIFLGSLILGYLGVLLGFLLWRGFQILAPGSKIVMTVTLATLVSSGLLGCLLNLRLKLLSPEIRKEDSIRIRFWRPKAWWMWLLSLVILIALRRTFLASHLDLSNGPPTFWRSVYLRNGVSPLLPEVLLMLGMYAWFWFTLQGLSLFGADRPVLPRRQDLPNIDLALALEKSEEEQDDRNSENLQMLSREDIGDAVETAAIPLTRSYLRRLAVLFGVVIISCWFALGEFGLRSLGDRYYGRMILLLVCLCIAMILADVLQLLRVWRLLRQLLLSLDRLRLRRALAELKLPWDSVWKMSGNVLEQRHHLISLQIESLLNLKNALESWKPVNQREARRVIETEEQLKTCERQSYCYTDWYVNFSSRSSHEFDIGPLQKFQEELAIAAGCVINQLIVPAWKMETRSLLLDVSTVSELPQGDENSKHPKNHSRDPVKPHVRAAEEFFILPYLGFIQNTIGRLRSLVLGILTLFVAATLAVSSYPFNPLPVIGAIFLITFALAGGATTLAYAEMHRDATLSHITNTRPGELGFEFWARLFAFGIGPLIGLLTTIFPSISDFLVSWLQPGAQIIR